MKFKNTFLKDFYKSTNKKDFLIDLLASGFYTGYSKYISGTVGSVVAIPIIIIGKLIFNSLLEYFLFSVILIIGSFYIAHYAQKLYQEHDSSKIVVDEIVAFVFLYTFLPLSIFWIIVSFILFRLFDVIKLWPANYFNKQTDGASVVLDDVFAGIYTVLACVVLKYIFG